MWRHAVCASFLSPPVKQDVFHRSWRNIKNIFCIRKTNDTKQCIMPLSPETPTDIFFLAFVLKLCRKIVACCHETGCKKNLIGWYILRLTLEFLVTNFLQLFYRFEHGFIPVDQLFSALHQCENLKLERIYLKCDNVPKFSVLPFENFLKTAKNLVLVFIVVSEIPKTSLRIIQRTLNQYKISRQQIFFAVQNERIFSGKLPIPDIHKYDMVELNTRVSVLDLFNDFVWYCILHSCFFNGLESMCYSDRISLCLFCL